MRGGSEGSGNKSIGAEGKKEDEDEEESESPGRNATNTPLETLGEAVGPSGLAAGQYLITDNYRL